MDKYTRRKQKRNRGTGRSAEKRTSGLRKARVRIVSLTAPVAGIPIITELTSACVKFEEKLASFPKVRDVGFLERRRRRHSDNLTSFAGIRGCSRWPTGKEEVMGSGQVLNILVVKTPAGVAPS
jgi:hypothetical protein